MLLFTRTIANLSSCGIRMLLLSGLRVCTLPVVVMSSAVAVYTDFPHSFCASLRTGDICGPLEGVSLMANKYPHFNICDYSRKVERRPHVFGNTFTFIIHRRRSTVTTKALHCAHHTHVLSCQLHYGIVHLPSRLNHVDAAHSRTRTTEVAPGHDVLWI
ncbi:hypothetical protein BV22DRAFT_192367 [Leucogyrophana mollusca]|uniref:Uncharacterized protein n=1 Tax=Leucogyrophana mollusca TaxID=85980 RepID=A0ACB8BUQ7_9AGAM|nr:hypothetical protein BV22DRAFT_192367 [Leucogyrophana mollusca]